MILKIFCIVFLIFGCDAVKNWYYTFVKFDCESKVDYISVDLTLKKINRGDYAVNGTFKMDNAFEANYTVSSKIFLNVFQYLNVKFKDIHGCL